MTSKRDLKKEIENLSGEQQQDDVGLVVFTTGNHYETADAAPRPELVVPDPDRGGFELAVPNVIPETFETPILFLSRRVRETWPDPPETDDDTVPLPRLWDDMSDEQRREERQIRQQNGDPLPPLLEEYETE